MHKNKFLEEHLIDSSAAYRKLYRGRLQKLKIQLFLGYISYALPVVAVIVFFRVHWDTPTIPEKNFYLFVGILFILLLIPGMFYFVFQDEWLRRKTALANIYAQYGEGALDVVLENRRFVLYARGFEEERNLGNQASGHPLDSKVGVSSWLEEEMDKRTRFSYFPRSLEALLRQKGYPVVGLGHPRLKREMGPVQLLFCEDDVWEQVFEELAERADVIILNTLEKHGDYWRKPGKGLEREMGLILSAPSLLDKTFVLHNNFEKEPAPDSRLHRIIKDARWAAAFDLHDPATQEYMRPAGDMPEGFEQALEGLG